MNLLLLFEGDRNEDDRFVLDDVRATHVTTVLKKGVGDTVRVGLEDGPVGEAQIVAESPMVLEPSFGETPPRPTVDMIVAVPRPKSLKKVLFDAAMLGVDKLVLIRTWRVDKSYLESPLLTPRHYRTIFADGLMQARHTAMPHVTLEPLFKPFVEDRAPDFITDADAYVIDPSATSHLGTAPITDRRVVLAIGPEGGFREYEVDAFERAGFIKHHLGERILRVETACVASLATVAANRAR